MVQSVKNLCLLQEIAYSADLGLIPGSGTSSGDGNGNPLQYSCLGNPVDRGTWQTIVHQFARFGHDLATTQPPP